MNASGRTIQDRDYGPFSRADIENFDQGRKCADGYRYFCIVCDQEKQKDRSLAINETTGAWQCFRCTANGQLQDYWEKQADGTLTNFRHEQYSGHARRTQNNKIAMQQRFSLSATRAMVAAPVEPEKEQRWRAWWDSATDCAGTPGATYLESRGIRPSIAHACGVKFALNWYYHPNVLFPIADRANRLVAVQGRQVEGVGKLIAGPKSLGAFVTPGLFEAGRELAITEAPIDALAIYQVSGLAALALCGTSWPHWLPALCLGRKVYMATDADKPGDDCAEKLTTLLVSYGARIKRLRPPQVKEGCKDWAEALLLDPHCL